jgi:CheY-like chemotaxis protein/anti-sigma regulatory factor (Ser/Thr protein kinase)
VPLADLLERIQTDFAPIAREKNLKLVVMPTSLRVRSDPNLLRRLVQNLVSNAIKYTITGKVLVGARRRGNQVVIQVMDSGIGIPPSKFRTVFKEFARLDEGAKTASGLGLGLSIVDRIARVLKLEIQIESHKGQGTRFSVILPVTTAKELPAATTARPRIQAAAALNGLSVVCIDNDARILEGMRLLLEGWGCEVRTYSGTAAFIAGEPDGPAPEIILADYHLDGENGLDVIRSLRTAYGEATPAVLITADRSNEVRAAADQIDVAVLNKPLKPAVLRSMMNRMRRMAHAAE